MQVLLTRDGCLRRQQRLCTEIQSRNWDAFLTGHARTIYYLTGALLPIESPAVLVIRRDGQSLLISPSASALVVDEAVSVETYSPSRVIADPFLDAARLLTDRISRDRQRNWAVESSYTPGVFLTPLRSSSVSDAGPLLRSLRKCKENDEIAEIRRALEFNRIAYDAARASIQPGLTEIDVHDAMFDTVTKQVGHTVTLVGDFACGVRSVRGGGPPTTNQIQPGDLYILDLFPSCTFYAGDTCRAFAVGEPTQKQNDTWKLVADTLAMAETMVRPGLPARELYTAVRDKLATHPSYGASFWHHAGHGIGIHGHEAPRLIPESDDVIEVGDVIAMEPALYSEELRGGIRLENSYVVRESGAERLFNYPLPL